HASPTSSGGSVTLLPNDSNSSGGRVTGGTITAEITVGDAFAGGVSNVTTNVVQARLGYTGQLYDAQSMVLSAQPGDTVGAGETLQLLATITLDDDTTLETSALNWVAEDGPIAMIGVDGLLTAGFPNTSSSATARGTFDLLTETFPFTITPQPVDPFSFTFSELGGTGPYRVLFGDSPTSLTATNTSDASFNPGDLTYGETYFWQVFDSTNTNLTPGGDGPVRLVAGLELELLQVGDANNPADASTGFGAVSNSYWMGEVEITNRQYAAFLNAVAGTDPNALFDSQMQSSPIGGIDRFGTAGNYTYAPKTDMAEKPVNFVSFWSVCRYCNWLHNGLPNGEQTAATTEDGAYDLTDAGNLVANSVVREADAKYYIPDQDEWDKAAYYDPRTAAQNGPPGDDFYWLYPTASDTAPVEATADASGNIDNDTDPIANYNSSADWNGEDGNVTSVGSGGIGNTSFYGFADMAGNIRELLESIDGSNRVLRGGDYESDAASLAATALLASRVISPTGKDAMTGFRVAALQVPIATPPPVAVADPNAPLRLSLSNKIKKLTTKAKKLKKSGKREKAKKLAKKIKLLKKRLARL
ncbi:MAG: SUMF1/EgtB/PvdO family nonheme iron enzyme, partial [Verrucomicrobiota bacterium]